MERVLVVGGRIAGCTTAIILKKLGLDVHVIEKASGPHDVISTHFMNPRGMSYLSTLGILDRISDQTPAFSYFDIKQDGFELGGSLSKADLEARMLRCHPDLSSLKLNENYSCIRRTVLDSELQKLAVEMGVHFHLGTSLTALKCEQRIVKGAVISSEGKESEIAFDLLVGADGRYSKVCDLLNIPKTEARMTCTFACYTYFEGVSLPHGFMRKNKRLSLAAVPTSHEKTMVLVFGPDTFYDSFKADREQNFMKAMKLVDPTLAETIGQGKRVEPFRLTVDQSGFLREAESLGVALVGDAANSHDQCTASGMSHALRDAFLLSSEVENYLKGLKSKSQSLMDYRSRRYLDSFRFYEFTMQQAEMSPLRPEEREMFEAITQSQLERDRFVGLYFDCISPRQFFKVENVNRLHNSIRSFDRLHESIDLESLYQNPFISHAPQLELEQTCIDYSQPFGKNFLTRHDPYFEFFKRRESKGMFQYGRTLHRFPGSTTKLSDYSGRFIDGVNFASQDYLGLGQHPAIRQAALEALDTFGPHSAGSPMIIGNTTLTEELEFELSKLTRKRHVIIFPTGYAAGLGGILGMVRPYDHIVMDRLSHACLQQGARASTKHVYRYAHLDVEAARAELKQIRHKDKRNAILLLTEGLFSMDADSPNLKAFQDAAHEFGATLFVDVAHDLGAVGPGGHGQMGIQNTLGKIDVVMGSFSKTFASNGGFIASDSESLIHYLKMYSTAHLFSNALSPIQTAVALKCARIIQSPEGEQLRHKLLENVIALRNELEIQGLTVMGHPSPIVPVMIGSERKARECFKQMTRKNVAVMIIEHPVVPLGMARFRLQVMASHSPNQCLLAARAISETMNELQTTAGLGEDFSSTRFSKNIYSEL